MSLSPARQHRLRIQAEQAAREGGRVRHASGYDLMLLQLAEDRRRLKGVQSTVKKAEIKVELLPKYSAWAEGVLAAGGAQQDDVLMYVMLWRIDAGDYAGALEIGRHALRHGWVMPLGNRNVQTVLAEEMADAAQSALLAAAGFDADLLLQTLDLTTDLDMPDQSRARLHKAIGAVLSESNPASALNHLNHALQLDPRCGVKKKSSSWSADCAMTAANERAPRTGGCRMAKGTATSKFRPPPTYSGESRMKFVAPEQAPEQAEIIRNTPFWPDVDLSEFRSVMRTDGTVTQPRLKQVALSAISEVNAELYEFRRRQQMLGYASLAEVPAEQLDGKSERIQHYFNAVYCWARAMLNERYQDYDATASGVKRGEELAEASGDLWRDARWAISRVQDAPHCTVELI